MKTLTLTDGRKLTYDTYGDPGGVPVIFSHGFSDSRLLRNPDAELTASLGVFVAVADQPGVGGSTPVSGRRIIDWGPDMEQLADHLGWEQFAVAGHSGGGPQTLAVAHHMPDRVTRGALASPVAPADEPGFMKMFVYKEFQLLVRLRHLHHVIRWAAKYDAHLAHKDIGSFVEALAEHDRSDGPTFFATPEQTKMFEENFQAGYVQDEEGVYELSMACVADWGFRPEDVTQPFDVFYGDADDIVSPQMPKRVAERLPNATAHVWPGAGHYGFVDRERWSEFYGALTMA